jgi:hypothetical protein
VVKRTNVSDFTFYPEITDHPKEWTDNPKPVLCPLAKHPARLSR